MAVKVRRGAALLLALCFLLPVAAWPRAAEEAQVLGRVETALATTFYQGLLVTVRKVGTGREEEVSRAWFGPRGRQAIEVITPSWRSGERLVVDGTYSWVLFPDCGAVLRLPAASQERRLAMSKSAVLEGTGRLAERPVLILRWEGQHGLRRVWVDAEHYVPLKREDRTPRGEMLVSQTLQEVQFPATPPLGQLRFTPDPGLALYTDEAAFHQSVSLPHVQRGVDFRIRMPEFLPPGFAFQRAFLRELPQLVVVQLRFGDDHGKALSLFEYRTSQVLVPPERQFSAESGLGPRSKLAFFRWRLGELDLVLVGNLQ